MVQVEETFCEIITRAIFVDELFSSDLLEVALASTIAPFGIEVKTQ